LFGGEVEEREAKFVSFITFARLGAIRDEAAVGRKIGRAVPAFVGGGEVLDFAAGGEHDAESGVCAPGF
jgi:hypothetical protein